MSDMLDAIDRLLAAHNQKSERAHKDPVPGCVPRENARISAAEGTPGTSGTQKQDLYEEPDLSDDSEHPPQSPTRALNPQNRKNVPDVPGDRDSSQDVSFSVPYVPSVPHPAETLGFSQGTSKNHVPSVPHPAETLGFTIGRYADFRPDVAATLARGKLESEWHMAHGERISSDLCAGCRRPIRPGDDAMALADDNRVHLDDDYECLIRHGERWRRAARTALGL